ncbi:MAG: FAD-binding oxidoreductase [Nanoarchaeota archaeon]
MKIAQLLARRMLTHDTQQLIFTRPRGFDFLPGQGVAVALNEEAWKLKKRPFSPTSLVDDDILEFIIKCYPDHHAVTEALHAAPIGTQVMLGNPFGNLTYRGSGYFLAGGVGITPFIAIARHLREQGNEDENTLIYSARTEKDIINRQELDELFSVCHYTVSRQKSEQYRVGRINKSMVKKVTDKKKLCYVCGPPAFVQDICEMLEHAGVPKQNIVLE